MQNMAHQLQNAQNAYQPQEMPQPYVSTIQDLLESCHKYAGDAQDALDRIVGCGPPTPATGSLSGVPNGAMDSLVDKLRSLRDRLADITVRANRIG